MLLAVDLVQIALLIALLVVELRAKKEPRDEVGVRNWFPRQEPSTPKHEPQEEEKPRRRAVAITDEMAWRMERKEREAEGGLVS